MPGTSPPGLDRGQWHWYLHSFYGANQAAKSGSPFEGGPVRAAHGNRRLAYAEINGSSWVSQIHDETWPINPGDRFSLGIRARCPMNNPGSCQATLALWGLNVSPNEAAAVDFSASWGKVWYYRELDAGQLNWTHDTLRTEVYIHGEYELEVDSILAWKNN